MKIITKEEIHERLKIKYPNEDLNIIQYNNLSKLGILQCNICGNQIYLKKFSNVFVKTKVYCCKQCSNYYKKHDLKLKQLQEYYNIINTTIRGSHTYYLIECKKCGHQRCDSLSNLSKHLFCGCQTGVYRNRQAEEFINEVNLNSIDGKYILLSEYKNQTTKVKLKHLKCNFIWDVRPNDVIKGKTRCPYCSRKRSFGELVIENKLKKELIPFECEKQLNHSKQKFDFYLELNNNKIAIEYNGMQHYKETNYFSGTLETYQQRDKKKAEYCKNNNIILYIIPYTFNRQEIEIFLDQILKKYNDYPVKE